MAASAPIRWYDVREWGVQGKGWTETERYFDRLPRYARDRVPPDVWLLSRHSTGMYVQFETESPAIHARWRLLSAQLAEPHMPATGVSGIDLYALHAAEGWRWVAVGRPETAPDVEVRLNYGLGSQLRRYRLYLPLYNGVESIEIGVDREAAFTPVTPSKAQPIVVYGTSIVHGIAASRPGMCHTAILGRLLDPPIVNLGFSGRAKMEPALAELLAEIEAAMYVVDCLPNMEPSLVEERAERFLTILRTARPNTPLVLVEDRTYGNAWIVPQLRERNRASRAILRRVAHTLSETSPGAILYVSGDDLLGSDDEATVDGSHPTDLGFWRIAERLRPILASVL